MECFMKKIFHGSPDLIYLLTDDIIKSYDGLFERGEDIVNDDYFDIQLLSAYISHKANLNIMLQCWEYNDIEDNKLEENVDYFAMYQCSITPVYYAEKLNISVDHCIVYNKTNEYDFNGKTIKEKNDIMKKLLIPLTHEIGHYIYRSVFNFGPGNDSILSNHREILNSISIASTIWGIEALLCLLIIDYFDIDDPVVNYGCLVLLVILLIMFLVSNYYLYYQRKEEIFCDTLGIKLFPNMRSEGVKRCIRMQQNQKWSDLSTYVSVPSHPSYSFRAQYYEDPYYIDYYYPDISLLVDNCLTKLKNNDY